MPSPDERRPTDAPPLSALASPDENDQRRSRELYPAVRSALVERGLLSHAGNARRPGRARFVRSGFAAAALFALGLAAGRASAPGAARGVSDHPTYLLLLSGAPASGTDLPARVAEYGAWAARLQSDGALVAAGRIEAALSGGSPDPSLAGVNGYFLVRAPDDGAAADIVGTCPHIAHGGRVTALRAR